MHRAVECRFDLAFNLVTAEQRHIVFVQLQLAHIVRHDIFDELACFLVNFRIINQNFTNVVTHVVAQGTDKQIAFLVHQERGRTFCSGFFYRSPKLQQIIQIPLQFFRFAAYACGADDDADVVRRDDILQLFA